MIQHIKTAPVPSAWQGNKLKVKKKTKSKDDTEEEDNVIDVLSLIPPEMLQSNTEDIESTTDLNSDEGLTSELNLDDKSFNTIHS